MREKAGKAGAGVGMWGAAGAMALLAARLADRVPDPRVGRRDAELARRADRGRSSTPRSPACSTSAASEQVDEAGSPVPEQTIETMKEDVQWAKHPTTSAKT